MTSKAGRLLKIHPTWSDSKRDGTMLAEFEVPQADVVCAGDSLLVEFCDDVSHNGVHQVLDVWIWQEWSRCFVDTMVGWGRCKVKLMKL